MAHINRLQSLGIIPSAVIHLPVVTHFPQGENPLGEVVDLSEMLRYGFFMAEDKRPPVWIGHVTQTVKNLKKMESFYKKLGMRPVFKNNSMAILELRAGTHLLLMKKEKATNLKLDLMVEDVHAYYDSLKRKKLKVGKIVKGRIHETFLVTSPDGTTVRVNSDHSSGMPV